MALANIIKEVDPPVELTQAEYDALSTAQKNDGTVYYITDGNGAFQTAATTPAEDTSGGDSNVQAELNKKVAKTDIVNNFTTTQAGYAADARALKTIADNYSLKTDLLYNANTAAEWLSLVTTTPENAMRGFVCSGTVTALLTNNASSVSGRGFFSRNGIMIDYVISCATQAIYTGRYQTDTKEISYVHSSVEAQRYLQQTGYVSSTQTVPASGRADIVTNVNISSLPGYTALIGIIPTYMHTNAVATNSYVNSNGYITFTIYNLTATALTFNTSSLLAFTVLYR